MFKGQLRTQYNSNTKRRTLTQPLTWVDDRGIEYTVPAGFSTDLDSVPRIPLVYAYLKGRATKAAVIHDWLYHNKHPRKAADKVFLAAMKDEGIGMVRRNAIYRGVRLFGWLAYT